MALRMHRYAHLYIHYIHKVYLTNREKSVVLTILNHNVYHLDHVIVSLCG